MKKIVAALCILAASTVARANDETRLMIAVTQDHDVKTISKYDGLHWTIDVGEVYQFVRMMSKGEYEGFSPGPDETYMLVKVGDVEIACNPGDLAPVPDDQKAQAALKYGQEVDQFQKTLGNTLTLGQRQAMIQELRHAHFISSYSAGEQMSDQELIDRYQQYKQSIASQPSADALEEARIKGEQEQRNMDYYNQNR